MLSTWTNPNDKQKWRDAITEESLPRLLITFKHLQGIVHTTLGGGGMHRVKGEGEECTRRRRGRNIQGEEGEDEESIVGR